MAYDILLTDPYDGRPNHYLRLYVRRDQTDAPNNRSSYAWEIAAVRGSGAISYALNPYPWVVGIGGTFWQGSAALDFRSGVATIILASGVTPGINHAPDGTLTISVGATHGPASVFGTADIPQTPFQTDRIARAPIAAPSALSVSAITPTSAQLSFTFAGDSGGSAITSYTTQWARDAAFTVGVGSVTTPGPPALMSPLNPGAAHWARVRANNAIGAGPYSAAVPFTTLSGVYVSDGSTWKPCELLVSDGAAWRTAEVLTSSGTAWNPAQ